MLSRNLWSIYCQVFRFYLKPALQPKYNQTQVLDYAKAVKYNCRQGVGNKK